ncbi:hypothetical protein [Brevundimonas sp. GCM10030266]|uniref:hypothetical protein n=1 Tax=Brevundimonas sp. GCM10030266 TaxID=3273386 RepID=UPI003617A1DA
MSLLDLILGKGGQIVTALTPAECHARLSAVIGPDFDYTDGPDIRGHITPDGGVLRQRSARGNDLRSEFSFSVRATDTGSRIVWRAGMSWFIWIFSAVWLCGVLAIGGPAAWNGLSTGRYGHALALFAVLALFCFTVLVGRIMARAGGDEMARFVTRTIDGRMVS